jgi:hypothetical protein
LATITPVKAQAAPGGPSARPLERVTVVRRWRPSRTTG